MKIKLMQDQKVVKEFIVNHKVSVTIAGKTQVYYCKHIQPSPVIRGIKLVGAVIYSGTNVVYPIEYQGDLRFIGAQMKIEKVFKDIIVQQGI